MRCELASIIVITTTTIAIIITSGTHLVVQVTGKANSVHDFAEQIGKKLAAAELLGAEGDVEGSIKLMEEVT